MRLENVWHAPDILFLENEINRVADTFHLRFVFEYNLGTGSAQASQQRSCSHCAQKTNDFTPIAPGCWSDMNLANPRLRVNYK
jgi:hypothetical protein